MFLYSKWLELDLAKRHQLAEEFGIKKKLPTHVQDNVVVSDGYSIQDIEQAITIDSLQAKLGSTYADMNILWDMLVNSKPVVEVPVVEELPKEESVKEITPEVEKSVETNEETKN